MKIVKYLIAALLVISITKKVHVLNQNTHISIDSASFSYDSQSKTVQIVNDENRTETYVGAVAPNSTVTPINIAVPALQFIKTIPALNTTHFSSYGSPKTLALYGLPVLGEPIPVYDMKNKQKIGKYWKKLNGKQESNQIVQLDDDRTFVCVIEQKDNKKQGYYAIGPVWTWYETSFYNKWLKKYGIDTNDKNFQKLVQKIGIIRNASKTIELFGVAFDPLPQKGNTKIFRQHQSMTIEKETEIPGMDNFTQNLKESAL